MSGFRYPEWLLPQEAEAPPARPLDPDADFHDALGAEDALTDFIAAKQATLHTGDDPLFGKHGREALLAAPAVLEQLGRLRDETLAQAPPSRRRDLGERLDLHLDEAREAIDDHLARQRKVWHREMAERRQAVNRTQAALSYHDPDEIMTLAGINADLAREAARATGLEPDSDAEKDLVTRATSGTLRAAVESALKRGDRQAAFALFDKSKDALSPGDAQTLRLHIDDQRQRQVASDYANKVLPPLPANLADLDGILARASSQNERDWAPDPTQRATNQQAIEARLGRHRLGLQSARAELVQAVGDWLSQPAPDGLPQTERPPSPVWTQLSADEQRAVDERLRENTSEVRTDDPTNDVAQIPETLFGRPPSGPRPSGPRFKEPIPGQSGKEAAKDTPSWARGQRPYEGESPVAAATRVMNERYGKDGWRGPGRPVREFEQLKKYFSRHFRDPKELPGTHEGPFGIPGEQREY